jgi:copper chaperone CopZ
MQRIELAVQGMTCGHCVAAVRRALEEQDGVQVEEVAIGSARVAYDPARTSPERLAAVVDEEGYAASVVEPAG